MASPLIVQDQNSSPYLSGSPLVTSTSSGSGSGGASGSTGISQTSAPAPQQNPQPTLAQISALNQGFNFSPLLNYVSNQGTAARNAIGNANTTFNNGLGTFANFGTDAQNTLQSVINGSQPLANGQNLLNQSYTGPASVVRSTYDPLVQQYITSANQTTNQNGVNALLGTMRPDLTPGDRNYDALLFGQNPTYQAASHNLVNDANTVKGLADSTYNDSVNAVNQRKSDVNNFNTAAQGFVQQQRDSINSAINNEVKQAQQNDTNLQNLLGQLQTGQATMAAQPRSDFAFDPTTYQPTTFLSPYGANIYNQTVNPSQFLTYLPGMLPTAGNVATPDQITQFNNAENLLGLTDQLTGSTRTPAEIGMNNAALQQALLQAQQQLDAANAAYLASLPKPTTTTTTAPTAATVNASGGEAQSPADASLADASGGLSPNDVGVSDSTAAADAAAAGIGGSDSSSGSASGGPDGMGDSGGSDSAAGNAAYARGGLVKQITNAPMHQTPGIQAVARLLAAHRTPLAMQKGGAVPKLGDRIPDTIPARVNDGEFVVRQPSVAAAGANNLKQLNNLDHRSPAQQDMARHALHAALSKVAGKGYADGGLTAEDREHIAPENFAGPDKSFPIEDKKHARLAIGGATRSYRAGNISQSQEEAIKTKARKKLA